MSGNNSSYVNMISINPQLQPPREEIKEEEEKLMDDICKELELNGTPNID